MAASKIPFSEIARAALSYAESLVEAWLPGGKYARPEYKVANPNRADAHVGSFSININTGAWADFATADAGKDLISLYAFINNIGNAEAAIEVADQINFTLPAGCRPKDKSTKKTAKKPPELKQKTIKEAPAWLPILPVPEDAAEPPKAHSVRGLPQRTWAYRDAAGHVLSYLYRFTTSDGGKETIPLTWCRNEKTNKCEWRWQQMPSPRPLYGLDRLAAKPDAWVLLVSGEKCADAAVELLPLAAIVTWPGGDNAVDKVDWQPLAGKNIYAWADCDAQRAKLSKAQLEAGEDVNAQPFLPENEQSGTKAMLRIAEKLQALDASTKFNLIEIPPPGEKPSGWDIADAIEEGMDAHALLAFMLKTRPYLVAASQSEKQLSTPPNADAEKADDTPAWNKFLLRKGGEIVPCLANVYDILGNDANWEGALGYNEHSMKPAKLKKVPYVFANVGDFEDNDAAMASMWLTRRYRFNPSAELTNKAIESLSYTNPFHPVREYLHGLEWDGIKRVDTWLLDFLGVAVTPYSKRVARWFLMGMVKRVLQPGCKFDYCLVLEGKQGIKKSSTLAILGGEWFGDTDLDLHNKDSMSALRGKWLYEFSELGSLARSESTKQKSFIARQIDEFRPVFGTREIRCPRQLVFGGSTNEDEWNKDTTGGRRFWPVKILSEIDEAGLKQARDQLFAEALVMVNGGLRYWPNMKEQETIFDPEQLKRSISESFVDLLYEKVHDHIGEFSLAYAATEWLKLDSAKLTRDVQTRIGGALRTLGCTKFEKRNDSLTRYWYKPPERNAVMSKAGSEEGGQYDSF